MCILTLLSSDFAVFPILLGGGTFLLNKAYNSNGRLYLVGIDALEVDC